MENALLILHLVITVLLIVFVLLQRSEGGALGIGGGGGDRFMSGRGASDALAKATWWLAAGFILVSLFLTILAVRKGGQSTLLDSGSLLPPAPEQSEGVLEFPLPPPVGGDGAPDGGGVVVPPTPSLPRSGQQQ